MRLTEKRCHKSPNRYSQEFDGFSSPLKRKKLTNLPQTSQSLQVTQTRLISGNEDRSYEVGLRRSSRLQKPPNEQTLVDTNPSFASRPVSARLEVDSRISPSKNVRVLDGETPKSREEDSVDNWDRRIRLRTRVTKNVEEEQTRKGKRKEKHRQKSKRKLLCDLDEHAVRTDKKVDEEPPPVKSSRRNAGTRTPRVEITQVQDESSESSSSSESDKECGLQMKDSSERVSPTREASMGELHDKGESSNAVSLDNDMSSNEKQLINGFSSSKCSENVHVDESSLGGDGIVSLGSLKESVLLQEDTEMCDEPMPRGDHVSESANAGRVCSQGTTFDAAALLPGMDNRRPKRSTDKDGIDNVQKDDENQSMSEPNKLRKPCPIEGRRCGLCGGGVNGNPPRRLSTDATESDNEGYDGSSATEEPNYDMWDGFGDGPDWLGRILGPIHDRHGIPGIWVHQQCAVWSPEVYFSGVGCLKSVRAALCRGRALKCSRCGRPGATIGCRVDRCPRTYHLPCARADGSVFDHRKFLIACSDHVRLFQPQGQEYVMKIRRLKARKMKAEMRKLFMDSRRKDIEAEEKWLEKCGEDEEFLKRESKRLHRDIQRILPTYIGGSEGENLYQGWESVAGIQGVVQCLKEVVILPLLYPEYFDRIGLVPPRGVLLHGYPGTGKTHVVRALIGACSRGDKRIAYFARKGADCLGKYVGDAERQLRLLFQVAEKCQPSIIFFDEIDGLAPIRSRQQDQTHNSVVSTLLALLDGLKSRGSVMVIGATNRPDSLDPALRRPGRFDREIYFPLPTIRDRSAILALHTRKWPKPVSGSLLWKIASKTSGFAGADLQALCTQAAIIALKKNCPLKELLVDAERNPNRKHYSLPSFSVEECDWLDALACAPPPCSRREAGVAANDVAVLPLSDYFVPCLTQPLVKLLMSLHRNEKSFLPVLLQKAALIVENILISAVEKRNGPSNSWWSGFQFLICEQSVVSAIESSLSKIGLLSVDNNLGSNHHVDTCGDDRGSKESGFCMSVFAGGEGSDVSVGSRSKFKSNPSGFRVLIAGNPRSGQKQLASCILYGFEGDLEIHKVDLATASQEGHGEIVQGITNILIKCQKIGACILYMPRIELWAVDEEELEDEEGAVLSSKALSCSLEGTNAEYPCLKASALWNSLMEQLESLYNRSVIVVATCEIPGHVLPVRIRRFFNADAQNVALSVASMRTDPHFCLHLDGSFDVDKLLDSSARSLSRELVVKYLHLIHMAIHPTIESEEQTPISAKPTFEAENNSCGIKGNSLGPDGCGKPENSNVSPPQSMAFASSQKTQPHHELSLKLSSNNYMKMNSKQQLLVATVGYQILRFPHFAELCWFTSKLKEGPVAVTNGPWKGWPFNSCITRPCSQNEVGSLQEKITPRKPSESPAVVRGLVAVGLLAYKGTYRNVQEVALEVRTVLELLVKHIQAKIMDGKDSYRFVRLLSHVAHVEDLVNSWAYTYQSSEEELQATHMASTRISPSADKPSLLKEDTSIANDQSHGQDVATTVDSCNAPLKMVNGPSAALSRDVDLVFEVIAPSLDNNLESQDILGMPSDTSRYNSGLETNNDASVVQETNKQHYTGSELDASSGEFGQAVKLNDELISCGLSNDLPIPQTDFAASNGSVINTESFKAAVRVSSVDKLCCYACCSKCFDTIHKVVRDYLEACLKLDKFSSTLEDTIDRVASSSISLVATVVQNFDSIDMNLEEPFRRNLENHLKVGKCVCRFLDIANEETPTWHSRQGYRELKLQECSCHSKVNENIDLIDAETIPVQSQRIQVLFRNSMLAPSISGQDPHFHCRHHNVCLCSLIGRLLQILQIKHPS